MDGWDLLIAHPPCTRLANSGVRWLANPPPGRTVSDMREELEVGADLFSAFLNCAIPAKAIENPVMHRHAKSLICNYRPFTQSIQPWQFGHGESKRTCLWLEGLPALVPTRIVEGREQCVWKASPGPDRWKQRSKTYQGIAEAMATQWSAYLTENA